MSSQGVQRSETLSGSSTSDEEAGEEQPLLPKATMTHHKSIFDLLVFVLPLSRSNVGHYWTLPVLLALVLFIISVTCQLGLTLIAGHHIRALSISFKSSLIRVDAGQYNLPLSLTPVGFLGAQVEKVAENFKRKWAEDASSANSCCSGANCAAQRIRCCDRSNVAIRSVQNTSKDSGLLAISETLLEETKTTYIGSSRNEVVMPKTALEETKTTYIGSSRNEVCYLHADGTLDCSPPSYLFHDAWDELDTNGDGSWSIEEAQADQANLGCRFGLSVNEMFRSVCSGIVADAQDTARNSYTMPIIPAEIENQRSISKDYFDWWKALAVICATPDFHRCGGLVQSGVFDGAIRMAREADITRGGVVDLDTALDFCQRLLMRNGICEQTLPSSYLMYRSRAAQKCGSPSYLPAGMYTNPYDDKDVMAVMSVDYSTYRSYVKADTLDFMFFTFMILMVWYVSLLSELQQILQLWDFLRNFPVNGHSPFLTPSMQEWVEENMIGRLAWVGEMLLPTPEASAKDGRICHQGSVALIPRSMPSQKFGSDLKDVKEVMVIGSHSRFHSRLLYATGVIRLFLVCYMADVGTSFILYQKAYAAMLMDAITLAFIFKVPEFLYILLVRRTLQEKLADASCLPYPTSLPTRGIGRWLLSSSCWGLVAIPACVTVVVYYNVSFNTMPFLEALQCACYGQGTTCSAAANFEKAWWDQYWQDNLQLAKRRASWLGG